MRAGIALGLSLLLVRSVDAYRPFDGTDADVADVGEIELEVSPATWVREAAADVLLAPSLVVNVGAWHRWELIGEADVAVGLDRDADLDAVRVEDAGLFLKGLLRRGSLQNASGPSVATEFGALLPARDEDDHLGGEAALIVSHASPVVTLHGNVAANLARSGRPALFGSFIAEGPLDWTVRPVSEVIVDEEFDGDRVIGGLAGLIWRVRNDLSCDVAYRRGSVGGEPLHEVRAGFTWAWAHDA